MVMGMHMKDIILPQEMTGMAMSANRHQQIVHNDGQKAVDTMIERIPKTTSTIHVTRNMTMSNIMNHGRHEVVGAAARHFTCQTCLMVRSRH